MSKPTITILNISANDEIPSYVASFNIENINTNITCTEIKQYKTGVFCMISDIIVAYFDSKKFNFNIDLSPIKA